MKTIVASLATAAALSIAISASGFEIDAAVVVTIAFAAGIAGLFVRDYTGPSRIILDAAPAPVRNARRIGRPDAGVEFASMATFHTMVG